jgi:phytoene dehydrogenase-like protein
VSTDRVVVVGAGHNGLVAACYLAREGLDVEVVERDPVLGGAVSTVERWPGYRVDRGSSAHIMVRHTGIVEDLDLTSCGLQYMDLDPWGFAPFGEDDITFHVDLDRTCTSIEKACGTRDAEAYRLFVQDWSQRNLKVFDALQGPPTPMRLGRAIWGAGKSTGLSGTELSRQFLTSADSLLDAHFEDERLKTALAWMGAQSGPPTHEPATADLVGWNTVMHLLPPGHPKGGSGMLSESLRTRLMSYGGRVRLGDGAAAITRSGNRVTGVVTDSGEHLHAATVIGACHVMTTLELLGESPLLDRARRTVRIGNGIGMVVRLATTGLPRYPTATPETYRALQLLAPSRQALRRAHGEFNAGLPPTEPAALAMTFSAFDDTLAPAGHVQTPLDLERELGLRQGQVMHVDMSFDQMFLWRPLPELASYRVPGSDGLYLCGASTHPGGGVFGASGRSAARTVLSDRSPSLLVQAQRKLHRA